MITTPMVHSFHDLRSAPLTQAPHGDHGQSARSCVTQEPHCDHELVRVKCFPVWKHRVKSHATGLQHLKSCKPSL